MLLLFSSPELAQAAVVEIQRLRLLARAAVVAGRLG
jgi:hypothetical protein